MPVFASAVTAPMILVVVSSSFHLAHAQQRSRVLVSDGISERASVPDSTLYHWQSASVISTGLVEAFCIIAHADHATMVLTVVMDRVPSLTSTTRTRGGNPEP